MTPYDAIVLAGGASTRFGKDKMLVNVGGTPVLERVLTAVRTAETRFVVGPERSIADTTGVRWLREEPPGSGPANSVACVASHLSTDVAVVLAGDLPYVDADTVRRLLTTAASGNGTVLQDDERRPQWLSAAVRTSVLRERLRTRSSWVNTAMHDLLGPLELVGVPARGDESHDIDTPDDIPSEP